MSIQRPKVRKNNNISYQTVSSTPIHLNSKDADIKNNDTMNSNVRFFFQDTLKINPKTTIETKLSVVNAQIPISWNQINSTNNKFYIQVSTGNKFVYYFQQGNYNVQTFITQWNLMFSSIPNAWNLTYSTTTNNILFNIQQLVLLYSAMIQILFFLS